MELVQPIRDREKIEQMKKVLKSKSVRDYVLFTLGINSALRISDILKLNISDVMDSNNKIKDRITLREKKTGKTKNFPLSKNVKEALEEFLQGVKVSDNPLFSSRNGQGFKAITRQLVHETLNKVAKEVGIKESIGTHSMRKSFGFHAYESGVDITRIQSLLNHSSPKETLRYIGITQDEMDDVYMDLNL